jgi:hypothetical protein
VSAKRNSGLGIVVFQMSKRNRQGGQPAKRTWDFPFLEQDFKDCLLQIVTDSSDLGKLCNRLDRYIAEETQSIPIAIQGWQFALTRVQSRAQPLPTEFRGQTWSRLLDGMPEQCSRVLQAIDELPFLLSIPLLTAKDRATILNAGPHLQRLDYNIE